jgi:hypothetical protein
MASSTLQATALGGRIELTAQAGAVTQAKITGTDTKGTASTADDVTIEVIAGLISLWLAARVKNMEPPRTPRA